MTEYGIWDDGQGGFIAAQCYSPAEATLALDQFQGEYRTAGEDPDVLSFVEMCPDHEEQPNDGCEECETDE